LVQGDACRSAANVPSQNLNGQIPAQSNPQPEVDGQDVFGESSGIFHSSNLLNRLNIPHRPESEHTGLPFHDVDSMAGNRLVATRLKNHPELPNTSAENEILSSEVTHTQYQMQEQGALQNADDTVLGAFSFGCLSGIQPEETIIQPSYQIPRVLVEHGDQERSIQRISKAADTNMKHTKKPWDSESSISLDTSQDKYMGQENYNSYDDQGLHCYDKYRGKENTQGFLQQLQSIIQTQGAQIESLQGKVELLRETYNAEVEGVRHLHEVEIELLQQKLKNWVNLMKDSQTAYEKELEEANHSHLSRMGYVYTSTSTKQDDQIPTSEEDYFVYLKNFIKDTQQLTRKHILPATVQY